MQIQVKQGQSIRVGDSSSYLIGIEVWSARNYDIFEEVFMPISRYGRGLNNGMLREVAVDKDVLDDHFAMWSGRSNA